MKKLIANKLELLILFIMSVTVSSCLKDKGYEDGSYGSVRNTEGGKYVTIRTAGLGNFQKSSVLINTESTKTDTVDVWIDLDYAQKTTSPQTVKLAIDNSKIAAYNAANGTRFQSASNDMVTLKDQEVTIPAGERSARTYLLIKSNKFDPTKSYMIPVTIVEAPGASLSSNLNTRFYNIIGNPFAGAYKWDFTRFNNATGTGAPNSLSFTGRDVTLLPVSETSFTVQSGYYIQPRYIVSFTNNNGVYSDLKVEFNAQDVKDMAAGGVTVSQAPKIIKFDPVAKEFIIQYTVDASGAARYLIDRYYK